MLRERRRHANFKPNRRLDRKSSRGMIYENEELRLRTININAEVERGQNDIRKLRRENEQLKREIWNLRDEYDKLHQFLNTNHNSCENLGDRTLNSGSQSEDSCDACKENGSANEKSKDNYYNTTTTIPINVTLNDNCNNIKTNNDSPLSIRANNTLENMQLQNEQLHHEMFLQQQQHQQLQQQQQQQQQLQQQLQQLQNKRLNIIKDDKEDENNDGIHYLNCDHLSIVSEENLSNSDGSNISIHRQSNDVNDELMLKQQEQQHNYQAIFHDNSNLKINQLQRNNLIRGTTLPQLTFPTPPILPSPTPPPLSQLKNLTLNQKSSLANVENTTTNVGITVIPPLSHFENICDEKFGLTVDTNCEREQLYNNNNNNNKIQLMQSIEQQQQQYDENLIKNQQNIINMENDIILSSNLEMKSPKHFFSPIKPNSEIVAIKTLSPHKSNLVLSKSSLQQLSSSLISSPPSPSLPPSPLSMQFLKFNTGPPDICVANVLGTNNNEIIRNINISSKSSPDDQLFQQTDIICSTMAITSSIVTPTTSTTTNLQNNHDLSTESLPKPMALFPSQLPYIGFENIMLPTIIPDQQIVTYTQGNANIDGTNKMTGINDILTKTTDTTSSNTSIFKSNNTTDSDESVLKKKVNPISNSNDDKKEALMYNLKTQLRKDELEFSQSVDNLIAMNRKLGLNIENLSSSVNDLLKPVNNDEFNIIKQKPDQQLSETNNSIISNVCQSQIHSTPNSPHSVGKRFNSNSNKNRYNHNQYQNNRKLSHESSRSTSGTSLTTTATNGGKHSFGNNNNNYGVKTSASSLEDGTTLTTIQSSTSRSAGGGGGGGSGNAKTIKSNSRRHSEGTVILQHLNRHHHHHNHHSHQHNDNEPFLGNLNISNKNRNYKNSAISIIHHGDSNHDLITGVGGNRLLTSTSERNSNNSLVSSRESSTSLNISTSRRKMSNVSHNGGGKIPWCGCWGNGCL